MAHDEWTLFPLGAETPRAKPKDAEGRVWTESKARLIAEYIRLFLQVTHDGTYIDAMAGPQDAEHPGTWAAALVLNVEPRWLRHFHLFDIDPQKAAHLRVLRSHHPTRDVDVRCGDFNLLVDGLLASGRIHEREPTFCLIDQITFECHWDTVRKLARHKTGRFKIEIFYFLANKWFERTLHAVHDVDVIKRWWGGEDVQLVSSASRAERVLLLRQRFSELGYAFVDPWPIYSQEQGDDIMYYMIHASDHPEARAFMERAYRKCVRESPPLHQIEMWPT